jgi:hypothetical protein
LLSIDNEQHGGNHFMIPEENTAADDARLYIRVILRTLPKAS